MLKKRTDRELVALALKGREDAYRELLTRYQRALMSIAFRHVSNKQDAEDLAQESFIKAFGKLETYKPEYSFKSWLFKIAYNTCIDYLRKKKLDTISLSEPLAAGRGTSQTKGLETMLPAKGEGALEALEHSGLGSVLTEAFEGLRPEYQIALQLWHFEDMKYEEIGRTMSIPPGTAKTYIHRARKQLKNILSETLEPETLAHVGS